MAPTHAKSVGDGSEELALEHLRNAGLQLVIRNFRCRVGEIDLVMLDDRCLVFVEVRCRQAASGSSRRFPTAIESIGPSKQRKLTRAAQFFLAKHKNFASHLVRFDVVAFDGSSPDRYELQWLKDAFRP